MITITKTISNNYRVDLTDGRIDDLSKSLDGAIASALRYADDDADLMDEVDAIEFRGISMDEVVACGTFFRTQNGRPMNDSILALANSRPWD